MSRKIRRQIERTVMTVILVPLFLELGLRIADPWKVGNLATDAATYNWQPHETRDYYLPPGVYHFSTWTATVQDDGTRLVPGTNPVAPCRIVLLGDSVTFPSSVDDADAWTSLVARQFPNVYFVNAAEGSYNLDNILSNRRAFDGTDGYVYLMINNDIERKPVIQPGGSRPMPIYLSLYWQVITSGWYVERMTFDEFAGKLRALVDDPLVTIAAFDGEFTRQVAGRFPQLRIIPRYTERTSGSDTHANAAGNREIAAAMLPIVKDAVQRACTAVI